MYLHVFTFFQIGCFGVSSYIQLISCFQVFLSLCHSQITVSDNGQPNLSSTSRVVVKVEDENDNAPQFTERVYRVRILEPLPGTQSVSLFRVVAFDKDSGVNAEITYTAKGTRTKFHVHPKTGEITSLSPQDLVKGSDHSISVSVF